MTNESPDDAAAGAVETTDAMRTVFEDGVIVNPVTFAEVCATVRREWAAYAAGELDDEQLAEEATGLEQAALRRLTHKTIKAVTEGFGGFRFNSAVARLYEFLNAVRAALRLHDFDTCRQMANFAVDARTARDAREAVLALADPVLKDLL